MKLFTIVVTYNATKWIDKCFGSLQNSTLPPMIIAIDNASQDGTPDVIRKKFPQVKVIESGQNIGFGKANNIGIWEAYIKGADYIFLLNQDAWVETETIEKLVCVAEKHRDFGVISPMHLNGGGTALDYNFSLCLNPSFCSFLYSDIYLEQIEDKPYDVNFVNAAAWLLSRNCIETVGGFNPVFFLYGEDDNYVQRLKYHSLRLGVYPFTRIFHDRETREIRDDFINKDKMYVRGLLHKFCNPGNSQEIDSEQSKLIRTMLSSLLKLNFAALLDYFKKYVTVKQLKNDTKLTKELSKKKGLSFLRAISNGSIAILCYLLS